MLSCRRTVGQRSRERQCSWDTPAVCTSSQGHRGTRWRPAVLDPETAGLHPSSPSSACQSTPLIREDTGCRAPGKAGGLSQEGTGVQGSHQPPSFPAGPAAPQGRGTPQDADLSPDPRTDAPVPSMASKIRLLCAPHSSPVWYRAGVSGDGQRDSRRGDNMGSLCPPEVPA